MADRFRLMVASIFGSTRGQVGWPGVVILVIGALIGFFASPIAKKLWPDKAEARTVVLRFVGLGLAFVGALLAVKVFG